MKHIQMVRLNRKRFALSQGELAILLALTQSEISKLEEDRRSTKLETAFALQVVFDVQPKEMFVRRFAKVEEAVMRRAIRLDRKLQGKTDAASVKKQRLLSAMARRGKPLHHA
jgi:transcriptional regulator with XRE-family HTH domain